MKVVVLYDGVAIDWTTEEIASVIRPVNEIARILAAEGHDVSRVGVRHDLKWLARARKADLVFNLCEGINGIGKWEDLVTATMELAGIPFTGAGSWTTTVCHHKGLVNAFLQAAGLPVPQWVVPKGHKVSKDFPLPAIVKPAAEDASNGIEQDSVVTSRKALESRVARLSETYDEVIVQEYVDGREFAVGFVGDVALPVSEINFAQMPAGAWRIVTFAGKWEKGSADDLGTQPVCPAPIDRAMEKRLVTTARAAWDLVGGRGYGRVDMRVDREGRPWILEVNPNPDISDDAGLSAMAAARGWTYPELVMRIFDGARSAAQRQRSVEGLAGATARPASHVTA